MQTVFAGISTQLSLFRQTRTTTGDAVPPVLVFTSVLDVLVFGLDVDVSFLTDEADEVLFITVLERLLSMRRRLASVTLTVGLLSSLVSSLLLSSGVPVMSATISAVPMKRSMSNF
jgi:hypothetical protein